MYLKIFIVGCPRSGTTWIRNMLDMHTNVIAFPTETHMFNIIYDPLITLPQLNLLSRLRHTGQILRYHSFRTLFRGYSLKDISTSIQNKYKYHKANKPVGLHPFISLTEFNELIDEVFSQLNLGYDQKACQLISSFLDYYYRMQGGDGKKVLVEKTPDNLFYLDVLLTSIQNAKIIEVIRDCRDVCASWLAKAKTKAWADKSIKAISEQWVKSIDCGRKYSEAEKFKNNIIQVRYEYLRHNTNTELKRILNFAQLDISENQINHIVNSTHISKYERGEGLHVYKGVVGDWANRLTKDEIATIHRFAGPTMRKLGYLK